MSPQGLHGSEDEETIDINADQRLKQHQAIAKNKISSAQLSNDVGKAPIRQSASSPKVLFEPMVSS